MIVPAPTNPQSYNRYSYVENRPLNLTDPFGHCATNPYSGDEYDNDYACWEQYIYLESFLREQGLDVQDYIGSGIDWIYIPDAFSSKRFSELEALYKKNYDLLTFDFKELDDGYDLYLAAYHYMVIYYANSELAFEHTILRDEQYQNPALTYIYAQSFAQTALGIRAFVAYTLDDFDAELVKRFCYYCEFDQQSEDFKNLWFRRALHDASDHGTATSTVIGYIELNNNSVLGTQLSEIISIELGGGLH